MAERDDDELGRLAEAASRNDEDAFRQLVGLLAPTLYALTRSLVRDDTEAQDLVQETTIRVWQKLPSLRDPSAVMGWACRIARNLCKDRARAGARRPTEPHGPESLELLATTLHRAATDGLDAENAIATQQARALLLDLIDELKPRYRTVFLMHVAEDLNAAEIAVALGCAIGTVESRLSRGRRMLAAKLEKRGLL